MSRRVPSLEDERTTPVDFAEFTFKEWRNLDERYRWWIQRWKRTINFLRGQHWQTLKEHERHNLPSWRAFPLINFTLAFYNDYLTSYLQSEVRYSALPQSPDPQAIDAAELSEQILKYLWDIQNMDRKRIDLGAWLIGCGTGVMRIFWDTNTGDLVPLGIPQPGGGFVPVDPETMQPSPGQEPEMVDRGEIGVEIISPQFVRWADSPSKGVMVGMLLAPDEVAALYGEEVVDRLSFKETHAGITADLNVIEQPGAHAADEARALVIEHYIPPSSQHPKGLWWTAAGEGREVLTGPWPIPIGRIPIVSFRWIPVPGEKHLGLSPLYDMSFQNKQYEKIVAKVMEWYERAKPKRLLKSGGGISAGDLTDEPFQEVKVNPGAEPEMLETQEAPKGLFRMLNQFRADQTTVSGKQFQQRDEMPEGVSQSAFRRPDQLKEGDETALAHINSRAAWKEVGEVLLSYVANFYTEKRVVSIQGEDKSFLWREFTGADLTDQGELAATIRVDEKSLYPWQRQAQRDNVISLLQSEAGQLLFSDGEGSIDMERVQSAMQAVGIDTSFDLLDPDVLEARNEQMEFRSLRQGQDPPEPKPWQNHAIHHEEHTKIPKSQQFRAWEPHQRKAFLDHIQQTEELLNQQAEAEREQMIEMERQMRKVREEEQLRASVVETWAESLIGLVADTAGLKVERLLDVLEDPTQFTLTAERTGEQGGQAPEGGQAPQQEG